MKIAVVTINRNNAAGLQGTMDSVLMQRWADLEYIVVDGASTDSSLSVIKANQASLSYWISEPDAGVYDAQNKGLAQVTAPYVLFLNSGDRFCHAQSLSLLAGALRNYNELVYGDLLIEEDSGIQWHKSYPSTLPANYFDYETLPHPASLIPTLLLKNAGGYDSNLRICADWKFFRHVHLNGTTEMVHVPEQISIFRADGISSLPEYAALIAEEKNLVKAAQSLSITSKNPIIRLLSKWKIH